MDEKDGVGGSRSQDSAPRHMSTTRADAERHLCPEPDDYPEPPPYSPPQIPVGMRQFPMPGYFDGAPSIPFPRPGFATPGQGFSMSPEVFQQFMVFQQYMGRVGAHPGNPGFTENEMGRSGLQEPSRASQAGSGFQGNNPGSLTMASGEDGMEKVPLDSEHEARHAADESSARSDRQEAEDTAEEMGGGSGRREPRGLKVMDLPDNVTEDDLIFLFENKRKTDGGAVKTVNLDSRRLEAVIIYEDAETEEQVLQKFREKGSFVLKNKRIKVAPATGASVGAREEEEEMEEPPCKTVEVRNVGADNSRDTIELYLENKRKGGGDIEDLQIDQEGERLLVTFEDPAVAARFVERKHVLNGRTLAVRLHVPPPPSPEPAPEEMYSDRLLLSGVSQSTSLDCLTFFLEAKIGVVPKEFVKGTEPGVFMVMFDETPDIGRLREVCQRVKVEGARLQAEAVPVSRTVLVTSLSHTTSKDAVELYFEAAKRSGGGEVESVTMLSGESSCLVTFLDPQVAIRVCKKQSHKLDRGDLQVSLYHLCLGKSLAGGQGQDLSQQQAYTDRVLLKGVSEKTTGENLNNFLEAKGNCSAQDFLCGEQPGVVLVVFKCEPDIRKLQEACQTTPLEGAQLVVDRVPISHTVLVKNLPASSANSKDAVELYFEAFKRSGGGEVTEVKMIPDTHSCLVSFQDPSVALRVSGREHQLDGANLEVSVFYPCLGLGGGSRLGDFQLPPPVELKRQDRYKLLYLKGADSLRKALEDELGKAFAQVQWPKKKSGTTVQLNCTLTPEVQGVLRRASIWTETAQNIFQKYMTELIDVKTKKVNPSLWSKVEEKLPTVQVQSKQAVTLFVEKDDHCLIFAGLRVPVEEIFAQVEKLVSGLEQEEERKKREVEESVAVKPYQMLLLKAHKFPSKAASKYPGLCVEMQKAAVVFRGLPGDVKNAQVEMLESLSSATSHHVGEFTADQLALLERTDIKRCLVEKFREEKLIGVWEVVGSKIVVYARATLDAMKVSSIVKKTLMDATDAAGMAASSQPTVDAWKTVPPKSNNPETPGKTNPPSSPGRQGASAADAAQRQPRGSGGDAARREMSSHGSTANRWPSSPIETQNYYEALENKNDEETTTTLEARRQRVSMHQRSPGRAGAGSSSSSSSSRSFQTVTLPGGLVVAPYVTDITKLKVCAIVSASNEQLACGGGVSKAISVAAGPDFDKECSTYVEKNGVVPVSEVCVTGPGRLPCDMVIHAVGPRFNSRNLAQCKKQLFDTYMNILQTAEDKDCREIAVPAISSGIFGMPKDVCIEAYSKALMHFDKTHSMTTLRKVHFVDVKDDIPDSLQKELKSQVASAGRAQSRSSPVASRSPSPVGRRSPSPVNAGYQRGAGYRMGYQ